MTERTKKARQSLADQLRASAPVDMAAASAAVDAVTLINKAIRARGVRQSDIAARIGITEGRVSQIVNGDGNVRVSTLARFLRAAGYRLRLTATPVERDAPPLFSRRRGQDGGEVFVTAKSAVCFMDGGVSTNRTYEISSVHPHKIEDVRVDWIAHIPTGRVEHGPRNVERPAPSESERPAPSAGDVNVFVKQLRSAVVYAAR